MFQLFFVFIIYLFYIYLCVSFIPILFVLSACHCCLCELEALSDSDSEKLDFHHMGDISNFATTCQLNCIHLQLQVSSFIVIL